MFLLYTYIDSGCANTNSYNATVYCCKIFVLKCALLIQIPLESGAVFMLAWCVLREETIMKDVLSCTLMDSGGQCHDELSSTDARTICKQLGYNGYSSYDVRRL